VPDLRNPFGIDTVRNVRVLITGASGLLGRYLVEAADSKIELHAQVRAPFNQIFNRAVHTHDLKFVDFDHLEAAIDAIRPHAIVHTAAEGGVDVVEGNVKDYKRINVEVPVRLAEYSSSKSIQFVHISSNAVYGNVSTELSERSRQDPVNDYGKLKKIAEIAVREVNRDALIVRPLLMYGWQQPDRRPNPASNWINALSSGRPIRVVTDIWTQPLSAIDCARVVWSGLDLGLTGSVNVSGGELVTLYEFAQQVAQVFGLDADLIQECKISDFEMLAPRPSHTEFNLTRMKSEFGISPMTLKEGLLWMREARIHSESSGASV